MRDVTLFLRSIRRHKGTLSMASIEIIIRDDQGRIIDKKQYDDEAFERASELYSSISEN